MRPSRQFALSLGAFALLLLWYGRRRFALGVDFTDEGAYLAWPMRTLFGEKPFVAELGTLLRPLQAYLYVLFKIHPSMTLYEYRLIGWLIHVGSFSVLATCLFRLGAGPLRSPLIAAIPLFVCNIFGLITPSYNSLASDFLTLALSLSALGGNPVGRRTVVLNAISGLALFVGTLAHPALGVIGAVILLREMLTGHLVQNVFRRQLTPRNVGALVFVGCWLGFALSLLASGALATWYERITLFRSISVSALRANPARFFVLLITYPFAHSRIARLASAAALVALGGWLVSRRRTANETTTRLGSALALILFATLVATFSYDPDHLPVTFVQTSLVLVIVVVFGPTKPESNTIPEIKFLVLLSLAAAGLLATSTFYFSPLRSWTSGILALPFAFAVGMGRLFSEKSPRPEIFRTLATAALCLAVICAGREHYRFIQRDAGVENLTASFTLPKLRHIRSTPERVKAIDGLHSYLAPRLARGQPLLVFDDCPMLYFLLDAAPTYGLAWATRYTQSAAVLARLDEEFRSRPLPRYAIRTLVDVSHPQWETAPRTDYANYPLNHTVTALYELEHTIHPFEIWRLKVPQQLARSTLISRRPPSSAELKNKTP